MKLQADFKHKNIIYIIIIFSVTFEFRFVFVYTAGLIGVVQV